MRRKIVLLLLAISSLTATAQHNLSGSRQSSFHTYIYRISAEEARFLYGVNRRKLEDKHLHSLVDSFATDTREAPPLQPGNYLFVQANNNRLEGELKTIDDLQIKLLNNNRDLIIAIHDKKGQPINDVQVFAGNKKMPWDETFHAFRITKKRKAPLIRVLHQGTLHFFTVTGSQKTYFWRKLANSFPVKYVVQPVKRLLKGTPRYRRYQSYFDGNTTHEKKYTGFMTFNKPKYKPGDTVKLKAWVTTKAGKPVNRPLLLRLSDRSLEIDTILTTLTPYRPGGYAWSFVLKDSLDLDLDEEYFLLLEEPSSRKYNLDDYEGDLDEEEYVLKRPVLMRGKFYHEEYELGAITFTARSDKEEHNRGNNLVVYCKAIDENELAVMDGRVELLIKPYGSAGFYAPQVFLPDTLWQHEQPMESLGETKIVIPDSIFPAASFGYEITCTFLNSNNEQKTVFLQQHFNNDRRVILFDQQTDSLHISLSEAGQPVQGQAMLYTFSGKKDTLTKQPVRLPLTVRIDPFTEHYEVAVDSLWESFKPEQKNKIITCRSLRTRDSLMIQVVNPHHLSFWYTIFAGNKVIDRGYGDSLLFIDRVRTPKNYFVSLQYIYANETRYENYTIPYKEQQLNVQVNQPDQVYPGQQVTVDISVTNAEGKPVANADITAYALTRKFNDASLPFIPYGGKVYKPRKRYNQFGHRETPPEPHTIKLNWQRWSREMHLDSIEYYRFLHPANIYTHTEAINHDTTQIAPFVVLDGELQPVHLVYIDEEPRFFSQAQQLPQYSFEVRPGRHALRIRTHDRLIFLDSICATAGKKTFISINADTANKAIRQKKMPDTLTAQEQALWSKYMILVENNFGEKLATIEQNDQFIALNLLTWRPRNEDNRTNDRFTLSNALAGRQRNAASTILTGPLLPAMAHLHIKDQFSQSFESEGNYLFNITKGLIKQKQISYGHYPFNKYLVKEARRPSFKDFVLTATDLDSLWQDYLDHRNATEDLFRNTSLNKTGNGILQISSPMDEQGNPHFIKSVILFRYDDPDFARIYKGTTRNLGYVQPGMYRLVFLLKGDAYFIKDSVLIKKDGINYYQAGVIVPLPKDSTSIRISATINNRESALRSYHQSEDLDAIKTTFNNKYLDLSRFTKTIYGYITDQKTGEALPGVSILVKGTSVATITNPQGYFELRVPEKGTIVVNYIGYNSVSKKITEESSYDIKMSASSQHLDEVVVVGYGTQKKSSITGAVTSVDADYLTGNVQGKAAGIMIRGISSVQVDNPPMVLVDGLPFSGDWTTLDKSLFADISVLKSAEATAIYGARAAGGVVVITTKKNALTADKSGEEHAAPLPGNTLRKNFRDDAYWQPALRTNQQGKASFTATWPDDITNWKTFVIAMGSKKRSGVAESAVRAFKALSAAIALPQFAVTGDSIQVIGKTMNYRLDSVTVNRTFTIDGKIQQEAPIALRNAHIDSFQVVIAQQDSARFKYTIQRDNGYFDGEERSIPVFKQGVQETKGFFATLEKDTSFTLQPDAGLGKMTIYAETSVLPVLLDEIESLRQYEYLCNEQMASKLKALLLKKKAYGYLNKEFKEEKNIRELITKLNQSKSEGLLWGWWNNNAPVLWISQHVTEAMLMAEQQGYQVNINKQSMIDYLVYNFDHYRIGEKIVSVHLLQLLSSKVDYKKYMDTLDKYVVDGSTYEKLRVLQLKQKAGLPIALDTFITKQHHTMFGNIYWGDEKYHFFNNSIQLTLAMYKLLQKAGNQEPLLKKIRYYFLEKRKDGKWRNTYESALILETILPDLLNSETTTQQASLTIAGSQSNVITTFPYTTSLSGGEKLTITKQKGMPVYFTAYQQSWNPAPQKVAGDFIVQSFFERDGQTKSTLKAGEAVTLKVKVTVKADADYVMVEVPIPAGCSYQEKNQSWSNNEVHREYFKNKVSLFCSSLSKGEYTFTVSLLPRYTGRYHLNPAKAEMMYFPVFYGREEMKKVRID
ncbi:hypothetical protein D3H65_22460 [Paraflavitalea soli]|uniref:Alpha-2-macroglobulin domain-containing protein n=1 Tax=Paraflavitalea soli TaxID=2315862 RepID=A0A3B7N2N8_9BACT|nr:carboxypeptidase-like regulatory domain-containing protein [Paraflavitalea soli]AXY76591.1 hypothetical protein D3H65_22460 [Paraflavitalea soli]